MLYNLLIFNKLSEILTKYCIVTGVLIMTILHLSDTHSQHRRLTKLPDADVIILSNDFTMTGAEQEVFDFINWFYDLSYHYKFSLQGTMTIVCSM